VKNLSEKTANSRRDFARKISAGIAGASLLGTGLPAQGSATAPMKPTKNLAQHVGADYHVVMGDPTIGWDEKQKYWTTKKNFEYHERCGVRHFTNIMNGVWNADEMKRWKDDCDKNGKVWEAIRMDSSYIFAKTRSDQEKKLAEVTDNIRKASAVGVKVVTMHWTLIPIRRNGHTTGRGGSSYHAFKLEDNWKDLPVEKYGVVNYDEYWDRITYFLKNIVPVCEQQDVRLGIHPYDPPGLPRGYQGVDTWDSAPASVFDSLKKYEAIVDSPYNGFQMCLGTVMEGLKNPKTELLPIVKYFAEKGKIYQIHMRNIKGGLGNFEEVYIDEGEANFIEVIRILRDTNYSWSICPDHCPTHPDDPGGLQAFAQAYGYIKGLIDAANAEAV
jgi:mannonate dehydratase